MTTIEALQLALDGEIRALALYRKLREDHPDAKETFSFLVEEEEKHQALLEGIIAELKPR